MVHYPTQPLKVNLSDYLSQKLELAYASLSAIFSEQEHQTIEKYFIQQKIEKVKELITYGEKSLSEIAYDLNYSSIAHLSAQNPGLAKVKVELVPARTVQGSGVRPSEPDGPTTLAPGGRVCRVTVNRSGGGRRPRSGERVARSGGATGADSTVGAGGRAGAVAAGGFGSTEVTPLTPLRIRARQIGNLALPIERQEVGPPRSRRPRPGSSRPRCHAATPASTAPPSRPGAAGQVDGWSPAGSGPSAATACRVPRPSVRTPTPRGRPRAPASRPRPARRRCRSPRSPGRGAGTAAPRRHARSARPANA